MAFENTNQVFFWLADKLLIAVLLLLVAFVFNFFLERSKARLAFKNEIAKLRVAHIGEVWSALNESEAASQELLRELSAAILRHGNDADALKRLLPLQDKSKEKVARLQRIADANRFWLGETPYKDIRSFHNIQMDQLEAFGSGDLSAYKEGEEQLNEARRSIISFIENPL